MKKSRDFMKKSARSVSFDRHYKFRERVHREVPRLLPRIPEAITGESTVEPRPAAGLQIGVMVAEHPAVFNRKVILPAEEKQRVRFRFERVVGISADHLLKTVGDLEFSRMVRQAGVGLLETTARTIPAALSSRSPVATPGYSRVVSTRWSL